MAPPTPTLKYVRTVTREHGKAFADQWASLCHHAWDTFTEIGIVEWPPEDREAQRFYEDIADEILGRTFGAVKDVIAEAFTKAAQEIITRERSIARKRRAKRRVPKKR